METTGRKIYRVRLEADERERLKGILDGGRGSKERRRRAHVLLLADEGRPGGGLGDAEIARVLEVGASTVERVRRQCVMEGLDAALERKEQLNRKPRLLDGEGEAKLTMLACSEPPPGQARWTLRLLGDRLVELEVVESISDETVRRTPKKNAVKPWLKKTWCIPPKASADFACAMEDVLKTYARDFGDDTVLVCLDETSRQQTKETRTPLPVRPGQPAGFDFEYERNGTANLFMICAPLDGWRHVEVTDRRTKQDFARVLRDIADVHFPDRKVVLVMDNLNTHRLSSLHETFEPAEASRLADRFEVRHTPKHGSWLNVAEIEINVLSRQCLDRRIPDRETLVGEVAAWQGRRNASAKPVNWRFRTEAARIKLKSLYPSIQ
ncbi:MAG: IS630 family transposase [Boseongicola sp.]|nr:IS630 family transposase [Boseongicola sp.]